jgi:hypothetical protein
MKKGKIRVIYHAGIREMSTFVAWIKIENGFRKDPEAVMSRFVQ